MDSLRKHKGSRKGKEKVSGDADQQGKKETKRGDNWTPRETSALINAIDDLQTKRNERGFSFTATENGEIYNYFMQRIPDSKRNREKIINRIKVVLKMFRICDELAKRSGGGWDDAMSRPIAPSEEEYEEMVRAKGENGRFLLKGSFPWYRKMETMVGGQTAAGRRAADTWDGSEPIHFLLDSQMTIAVSSQGSSDSPNEECARSTGRQQTSNSDARRSGNSGSKRKSTDESSEPNSRSKRYKERSRMRQTEVKELAMAAKELAASWRDDTKAMTAPSEEQTASIAKLDQLGLSEEEYFF